MSVKRLCVYFGYTRQAYYKSLGKEEKSYNPMLLKYIIARRTHLQVEGLKKLYFHISRETEFNVSRAYLWDILLENGLIIKPQMKVRSLTDSSHRKPVSRNHLQGNKPEHVFEVLVSDITYLKARNREYYLTAIMDLYSRMILSFSLTARLNNDGLIGAFLLIAGRYSEYFGGCIFHSDRGTQYCSNAFRELAAKYDMVLSNSRNGNPYDNACMERVFMTLKNEYFLNVCFPDLKSLERAVKEAVYSYNSLRLHMSLENRTPKEFFIAGLKSYEHINKERKSSKKKENIIIN